MPDNVSVMELFLRYKNDWIRVERAREQHTLDLHMGIPYETVTLTAFGRNTKLYADMLEEGFILLLLYWLSYMTV